MIQVSENCCELPRCRNEAELIFYGHKVCAAHWHKHCNNEIDLKRFFEVNEND
jgi:hypothetical protein